MLNLVLVSAHFQWRIYQGHEQGLAWSTFLLLAMRRKLNRTTLRAEGRPSVLRHLLRIRLCERMWKVQQDYWYRFQGLYRQPIFFDTMLFHILISWCTLDLADVRRPPQHWKNRLSRYLYRRWQSLHVLIAYQ